MNITEHLDNLTRHIELVREACELLGRRLIEKGEDKLGVRIIARGYVHDSSKFAGCEWQYLHTGPNVDDEKLEIAKQCHWMNNDHHPEYWDGISLMPKDAVGEMVCDWLARSQEFGTNLREWIEEVALTKYNIEKSSEQYKWIQEFVDLLLINYFTKDDEVPKPRKKKQKKNT